jgi:hypothetical protein
MRELTGWLSPYMLLPAHAAPHNYINHLTCYLAKSVFVWKGSISPEFKAGGEFEPEEYMEYFEDSNPLTNAEIG